MDGYEDGDSERADAAPVTLTRRSLLRSVAVGAAGTALLAGSGAIGYEIGTPARTPSSGTDGKASRHEHSPSTQGGAELDGMERFYTRTDLLPPRISYTVAAAGGATRSLGDPSDEYVFLSPSAVPGVRGVDTKSAIANGLGQEGVMISHHENGLVWFLPTDDLATDLQVQTFKGEPVLTYWTGAEQDGTGYGHGVVLDGSYRQIATVRAGNGLKADLHELVITPRDTALITAYTTKTVDLSGYGGHKNGKVLDGVVQEVDIASGKLLFEWHSLDHVGLDESYAKPGAGPFDFFHVNSVDYDTDEDHLIISARNTWAVYRVARASGTIDWRLGGKKSDFSMGQGTSFAWQHHARRMSDGTITLFDDGSSPPVEPRSRGLVLALDSVARSVRLVTSFAHPLELLVPFEGSMQLLSDGGAFVGWGGQPYFTRFAADGALLVDGRFPMDVQSYRAFLGNWKGQPVDKPAVVVRPDTLGGYNVYASWNGATELASWSVLAGKSAGTLEEIARAPRAGFETAMAVQKKGTHLQVVALDGDGRHLGASEVVSL